MPLLWLEQAPRCEHVTLGDESSKGTEVSAACLPTPGTPRGSRSPHQGPGRGEGVGRMAGPSVPQLTTGRGLGLATPLLLGLPAQACGGTAAGRVQLAQRGGSRLLLFGSLVSSWRWNRTDLPFPITWPPPGGVRWPHTCSLFQILPGDTAMEWFACLFPGHLLHTPGCWPGPGSPGLAAAPVGLPRWSGTYLTRKTMPLVRVNT